MQTIREDGWPSILSTGSVSRLAISLDSHSMYVYAADGLFTALQEVKASSSSSDITGQTDFFQVLYLSIGQRYSVMIKLNQPVGNYYLRYSTYPTGDMQQVLEGQAIVAYKVGIIQKPSAEI